METPDVDDAKQAARKIDRSPAYKATVRGGLVVYGVVHLLIAFLTVQLAIGASDEEASQAGAMRALANTPLGPVLLWAVAVGFFALTLWQLLSAFIGHHEYSGAKLTRKRLGSGGKAVVYAALGIAAANVANGTDSEGDTASAVGGSLMALPFGQVLVALVGLGVAAVGAYLASKAFTGKWSEDLHGSLSGRWKWLPRLGYVAKGVSFLLVGQLFVFAAWTYDPETAGGLDAALQSLRSAPFGPWMLAAVALGFACFGFYCFLWARRAKV
ncbi:DUF1206 domain-containing protein [Tessaracoccus sp. OS52]|uniref:DUF1206 domain-containing protein n=1 Tax=Tessaracoccus sp. OS52 TaxID=2886691 RepID=UPI001D104ED1|nr:DUF1206 domain-containing protein [Tessaracoccus sp. OS52]MCC2592091.1 DUF1206 domain-containing protein [Tessaracoccus sp. OS52]